MTASKAKATYQKVKQFDIIIPPLAVILQQEGAFSIVLFYDLVYIYRDANLFIADSVDLCAMLRDGCGDCFCRKAFFTPNIINAVD